MYMRCPDTAFLFVGHMAQIGTCDHTEPTNPALREACAEPSKLVLRKIVPTHCHNNDNHSVWRAIPCHTEAITLQCIKFIKEGPQITPAP